jgi:RNA polymerase sigma-70 factor (ECF subfamily)
VHRVLDNLTDDQRNVILLRVLGGLSVNETAEAVDKTSGAVRVIQHRALSLLRDQLAPDGVA